MSVKVTKCPMCGSDVLERFAGDPEHQFFEPCASESDRHTLYLLKKEASRLAFALDCGGNRNACYSVFAHQVLILLEKQYVPGRVRAAVESGEGKALARSGYWDIRAYPVPKKDGKK